MVQTHQIVLAASAGAGVALLLSFLLYKRRRAASSLRVNEEGEEDLITWYKPVTDVNEYSIFIITSLTEHACEVEQFVEGTKQLKVVGLDCEWVTRDGIRRPVALLQLSSPLTRICLLFRMDQLEGQLPDGIITMLQDRSILKIGVGVVEDGKKMAKDHQIVTKGCLDLRHLALRHLARRLRGRPLSLQELSTTVLNHEMEKNDELRCGDWEADPLLKEQVDYAAADSVVGSAVFLHIVAAKLKLCHLEDFLQSGETWRSVSSLCQGLLDKRFHNEPIVGQPGGRSSKKPKGKGNVADDVQKPLSSAYKSRQSVMYHNCRLLSPDGTLLCQCELRKAKWYMEHGIGELVSEDPLTVRLLFEPKGVPGPDREYYLQDKENKCVVCGREDSYLRKNVVPHEYRRHFPEYLKKHSSHDVVLLCLWCHQKSCNHDNALRQDLVEKYNAPISNKTNAKRIEDPVRVRVRSSARALIRNQTTGNIPKERLEELRNTLMDYFNVEQVNDDLLQMAMELDTKVDNEDYAGSHGCTVIDAVKLEEDGFQNFEKLWRQNFVNKMEPKYMPALWSVDHRHEAAIYKKN